MKSRAAPGHNVKTIPTSPKFALGSWRMQFTRPPGWRRGPWLIRGARTQRTPSMRVVVAPWFYLDYRWGQWVGATLVLPFLWVEVWRWTSEDWADLQLAHLEGRIATLGVPPPEDFLRDIGAPEID